MENLGIDKTKFGKIYSFVDFGNVNHWFDHNTSYFSDGRVVGNGQKIIVDLERLGKFVDLFSQRKFFYYGIDPNKPASKYIISKAEKLAKFKIITKPIQKIKHYLSKSDYYDEQKLQFRQDQQGKYIFLQKCNFDVEITVDVLRLATYYDTLVLFSSDSDFSILLNHLRSLNKRVILFYSGHIAANLKISPDLLINSQRVREMICCIK